MLLQCFEFLSTFLEVMIGMLFTIKVEGEEIIKWRVSLLVSFFTTSIAYILVQNLLFALQASIVGILGIAISSSVIYELRLKDTTATAASYMLLLYITDFLAISILGILFHEDPFASLDTEAFSFNRVGFIILSETLLIIVYLQIMNIDLSGARGLISKMWLGLFAFGIFILYFVQVTFCGANTQTLMIWNFLIILVVLMLYSCSIYADHMMAKRQMELMARNYDSFIYISQKFRYVPIF